MKRRYAFFFIASILIGNAAVFFSFPRKVDAIVPTWDWGLSGPTLSVPMCWDYAKEAGPCVGSVITAAASPLGLDAIATWLAKVIIQQFLDGIVRWVRSGQDPFFAHGTEGSLFVTNIDQFVLGAADNAAGVFLSNYLGPETYNQLCRPFRLNIAQLLGNSFGGRDVGSFRFKARCTVTDIVANLEDFYNDFDNGGWAAWMATANYENNPLGFSILATEHSRELQNRAATANDKDHLAGQGFPGVRKCTKQVPKRNADGTLDTFLDGVQKTLCDVTTYITTSPGKFVEEQLGQANKAEEEKIVSADEINEVVVNIFSALLTWTISGGGGSGGLLEARVGSINDRWGGACGANNRGEECACTTNAQCASDNCSQGICLAPNPGTTCSGATGRTAGCGCLVNAECASHICSQQNICTAP